MEVSDMGMMINRRRVGDGKIVYIDAVRSSHAFPINLNFGSQNFKVEIDLKITERWGGLFHIGENETVTEWRTKNILVVAMYNYPTDSGVTAHIGGYYKEGNSVNMTKRNTFVFNGWKGYRNGTLIGDYTSIKKNILQNTQYYLEAKSTYYGMRVWEDDVLISELHPAKKGKIIGFYDSVRGIFIECPYNY